MNERLDLIVIKLFIFNMMQEQTVRPFINKYCMLRRQISNCIWKTVKWLKETKWWFNKLDFSFLNSICVLVASLRYCCQSTFSFKFDGDFLIQCFSSHKLKLHTHTFEWVTRMLMLSYTNTRWKRGPDVKLLPRWNGDFMKIKTSSTWFQHFGWKME